ncbi:MAG: hypothetical protein H7329_04035 [Opitutaceae bacterium]|nr:hypothetical protein [Cytophagales bacterium]
MKKYRSKNEQSGVIAYDSGDDYIMVKFVDETEYLYNENRPGKLHIEKMKTLAQDGEGLATYINVNVRNNYFKKLN